MAKGWIKIRTSAPSKEIIKDIDAVVIVAMKDLDDTVAAKVSIMSSEDMNAREALIHALPAIAEKIRSFGKCSQPNCAACDNVFRIANGIDALTGAVSVEDGGDASIISNARH